MTGIKELGEGIFEALKALRQGILTKIGIESSKTNSAIEANTAAIKQLDERAATGSGEFDRRILALGSQLDNVQRAAESSFSRGDDHMSHLTEGLAAINSGVAEIRNLLTQQGGDASGAGPLFTQEQLDELRKGE